MKQLVEQEASAQPESNRFASKWLGSACVCVIQLSRSGQASPWLEHQDDVSGLTCIKLALFSGVHAVSRCTKFNVSMLPKSAKGRDAEIAKDAGVR